MATTTTMYFGMMARCARIGNVFYQYNEQHKNHNNWYNLNITRNSVRKRGIPMKDSNEREVGADKLKPSKSVLQLVAKSDDIADAIASSVSQILSKADNEQLKKPVKSLELIFNPNSRYKFSQLLGMVDDLDTVSTQSAADHKALIRSFIRKLIETAPELSDKQRDAINLLTGVELRTKKTPIQDNFLDDNQPLKFKNFDKEIIVLQALVRIISPKLIQQREEQICGVTAMMHAIVADEPASYVKYLRELATTSKAKLSLHGTGGLDINISKNEKLFNRLAKTKLSASNPDRDYIDDVDFIALVGLRSSENQIFNFSLNSSEAAKSMFGVSFAGEIKSWMRNTGYENVSSMKLKSPKDIEQLELLIKDGYAAVFLTTADLTDLIIHDIQPENPGMAQRLLNGHFIQIKNIKYIPDTNDVMISIVSWGQEKQDVRINYDDFKKVGGFAKAVIGITPRKKDELNRLAKEESSIDQGRLHPYRYIQHMLTTITNQQWRSSPLTKKKNNDDVSIQLSHANYYFPKYLREPLSIIMQAKTHKNGMTWLQGAKMLQDYFYYIEAQPFYSKLTSEERRSIQVVADEALKYIICERNIAGMLQNQAFSPTSTQKSTPEEILTHTMSRYHDAGCLIKLVEFYVNQNRFDEAQAAIDKAITENWLNEFEKDKLMHTIIATPKTEFELMLESVPSTNIVEKFTSPFASLEPKTEFENVLEKIKLDNPQGDFATPFEAFEIGDKPSSSETSKLNNNKLTKGQARFFLQELELLTNTQYAQDYWCKKTMLKTCPTGINKINKILINKTLNEFEKIDKIKNAIKDRLYRPNIGFFTRNEATTEFYKRILHAIENGELAKFREINADLFNAMTNINIEGRLDIKKPEK